MSMVTDIRTICPLETLATTTGAAMYVATSPSQTEGLGLVADSSTDIAAIFSNSQDSFSQKMREMFYKFVRGGDLAGVMMVGDTVEAVDNIANCPFWRETEPAIVPDFGKMF